MSNNIDIKYESLDISSYRGVQEDKELSFYQSYGVTTGNIRDAESAFLTISGYNSGSVEDRWNGFLRSRGYTGSVDDMLPRFWDSVAIPYTLDLNFVSIQDNTLFLDFANNSYKVWEDSSVGLNGEYKVLV